MSVALQPELVSSPCSTEVLQLLLEADEYRLSVEARSRLLEIGTSAVDTLLDVVMDDRFLPDDSPGLGWAPGHAARVLGDMKATEAIEPMLRRLAETAPLTWLRDSLAVALSQMGPAALEPVLRAHDTVEVEDLRDYHCGILADLGVRDERSFERLLQHLERRPDFAPGHVAKYGDERALPFLHSAFDRLEVSSEQTFFVNQVFIELEDAIVHLGGALSPLQSAKFDAAMRVRDAVCRSMRGPARPRPDPIRVTKKQKIGRNDPCGCGSGKKLKKCHPD